MGKLLIGIGELTTRAAGDMTLCKFLEKLGKDVDAQLASLEGVSDSMAERAASLQAYRPRGIVDLQDIMEGAVNDGRVEQTIRKSFNRVLRDLGARCCGKSIAAEEGVLAAAGLDGEQRGNNDRGFVSPSVAPALQYITLPSADCGLPSMENFQVPVFRRDRWGTYVFGDKTLGIEVLRYYASREQALRMGLFATDALPKCYNEVKRLLNLAVTRNAAQLMQIRQNLCAQLDKCNNWKDWYLELLKFEGDEKAMDAYSAYLTGHDLPEDNPYVKEYDSLRNVVLLAVLVNKAITSGYTVPDNLDELGARIGCVAMNEDAIYSELDNAGKPFAQALRDSLWSLLNRVTYERSRLANNGVGYWNATKARGYYDELVPHLITACLRIHCIINCAPPVGAIADLDDKDQDVGLLLTPGETRAYGWLREGMQNVYAEMVPTVRRAMYDAAIKSERAPSVRLEELLGEDSNFQRKMSALQELRRDMRDLGYPEHAGLSSRYDALLCTLRSGVSSTYQLAPAQYDEIMSALDACLDHRNWFQALSSDDGLLNLITRQLAELRELQHLLKMYRLSDDFMAPIVSSLSELLSAADHVADKRSVDSMREFLAANHEAVLAALRTATDRIHAIKDHAVSVALSRNVCWAQLFQHLYRYAEELGHGDSAVMECLRDFLLRKCSTFRTGGQNDFEIDNIALLSKYYYNGRNSLKKLGGAGHCAPTAVARLMERPTPVDFVWYEGARILQAARQYVEETGVDFSSSNWQEHVDAFTRSVNQSGMESTLLSKVATGDFAVAAIRAMRASLPSGCALPRMATEFFFSAPAGSALFRLCRDPSRALLATYMLYLAHGTGSNRIPAGLIRHACRCVSFLGRTYVAGADGDAAYENALTLCEPLLLSLQSSMHTVPMFADLTECEEHYRSLSRQCVDLQRMRPMFDAASAAAFDRYQHRLQHASVLESAGFAAMYQEVLHLSCAELQLLLTLKDAETYHNWRADGINNDASGISYDFNCTYWRARRWCGAQSIPESSAFSDNLESAVQRHAAGDCHIYDAQSELLQTLVTDLKASVLGGAKGVVYDNACQGACPFRNIINKSHDDTFFMSHDNQLLAYAWAKSNTLTIWHDGSWGAMLFANVDHAPLMLALQDEYRAACTIVSGDDDQGSEIQEFANDVVALVNRLQESCEPLIDRQTDISASLLASVTQLLQRGTCRVELLGRRDAFDKKAVERQRTTEYVGLCLGFKNANAISERQAVVWSGKGELEETDKRGGSAVTTAEFLGVCRGLDYAHYLDCVALVSGAASLWSRTYVRYSEAAAVLSEIMNTLLSRIDLVGKDTFLTWRLKQCVPSWYRSLLHDIIHLDSEGSAVDFLRSLVGRIEEDLYRWEDCISAFAGCRSCTEAQLARFKLDHFEPASPAASVDSASQLGDDVEQTGQEDATEEVYKDTRSQINMVSMGGGCVLLDPDSQQRGSLDYSPHRFDERKDRSLRDRYRLAYLYPTLFPYITDKTLDEKLWKKGHEFRREFTRAAIAALDGAVSTIGAACPSRIPPSLTALDLSSDGAPVYENEDDEEDEKFTGSSKTRKGRRNPDLRRSPTAHLTVPGSFVNPKEEDKPADEPDNRKTTLAAENAETVNELEPDSTIADEGRDAAPDVSANPE
jgi:hypothetical protein